MRDSLIISGSVVAAVVIAGLFFLFGSPAFTRSTASVENGTAMTVLAEGDAAPNMDRRVNYRITNQEDFAALWEMIYPEGGSGAPAVDFEESEVLAAFDGSHSSGGYRISIESIEDRDGTRTTTVVHEQPAGNCPISGSASSPFVIVKVEKSSLPLSRIDRTVVNGC